MGVSLAITMSLISAIFGGSGRGRAGAAPEPLPSTDRLADLLDRYVIAGGVDYRGLETDRDALDAFLDSARGATPDASPRDEALAFWINVYNSAVLHLVLERIPGLESVMDVDGFFKGLTVEVAGESMTLNEIEARALAFGDPRVHFAVVCASQSCPDLRGEPYLASELDSQLDDQTRSFLADQMKGARLDSDKNVLWLSSIFKWYGGDFAGGTNAMAYLLRARVLKWVAPYLPNGLETEVSKTSPAIRYLDYDWSLNERER